MNEEFVSFDLAKKLKEKGFNCECPFAMYNKYEQFCPLYSSDKDCFGIDDFDKYACIAPTISQVLKWLREEKQLHIVIVTGHDIVTNTHLWGYKIWDLANHVWLHAMIADNSYELATLSGIEFVIDNL